MQIYDNNLKSGKVRPLFQEASKKQCRKCKRKGCDGEHHDPHKHKKVQAAASGGCQDRSPAPCRYGCTYSERYATMAFRGSEGQAGYREICRIQ